MSGFFFANNQHDDHAIIFNEFNLEKKYLLSDLSTQFARHSCHSVCIKIIEILEIISVQFEIQDSNCQPFWQNRRYCLKSRAENKALILIFIIFSLYEIFDYLQIIITLLFSFFCWIEGLGLFRKKHMIISYHTSLSLDILSVVCACLWSI